MKKTFRVAVDCANCARKMEEAIKKISGVGDATLNFMMQKLSVDFAEGADAATVMKEALKACRRIEPDCEIEA